MQIRTNFPAKSLSIYTKSFSWHLSNDLTETYLIKLNKNLYLITLSETIKITKKTEYFGESIINQIYKRQDKIMNNFYWQLYDYNKRWWNKIQLHKFFLKKTAHAYFWAPYFSKSFGGKIHHNWTDVTYRIIKQKNWRMRILGARIFLSFLAGKFWIFKQPIINSFPQSNKIAIAYIWVRVLETGVQLLTLTLRILERKGVLLFCTSE